MPGEKRAGLTEANKALQVQVMWHMKGTQLLQCPCQPFVLLARGLQLCFSDVAA